MPYDKVLARKAFTRWADMITALHLARKKSMMRKFVSVRGGPTTIRRMFFRDWVKFVFQKRMESRMLGIREKIANRNQNRKTGSPKAGYTMPQLIDSIEVMKMTEVSVRSVKEMNNYLAIAMAAVWRSRHRLWPF